ncbi:MAG: phosphate ABC transporter permease PstA [Eubacteriales bacterium]
MNLVSAKEHEYVITRQEKPQRKHRDPVSLILRILVILSAALTMGVLLLLIGYILVMGIPNLKLSLFEWNYTSDNLSMMPAIINTITMTVLSLVIALPLGLGAAIYLTQYAKKGSKVVKLISLTTETLAGIPSIIFGLFGFLFFVVALHFGYSMLSGALTLAMMVLPTIMRTSQEALLSVPASYTEGSMALGAGRLRTIFKTVLPSAVPGILAGVILSVGRIVGETAALIYTSGTVEGIPKTLMGSGRTLAIHMFSLWREGLHKGEAYATAVVLLVVVFVLNSLSAWIARKIKSK